MLERLVHPLNAPAPMYVTLLGITMLVMLVQLQKTPYAFPYE